MKNVKTVQILVDNNGIAEGMGYGIEADTYEEAYQLALQMWNADKMYLALRNRLALTEEEEEEEEDISDFEDEEDDDDDDYGIYDCEDEDDEDEDEDDRYPCYENDDTEEDDDDEDSDTAEELRNLYRDVQALIDQLHEIVGQ